MRSSLTRRNRTACSILALATVLAVGATPASAQSFQATGTPLVGGSATITTPTGTSTQVVVNNPQTVITWTPFDTATSSAPIIFQPGSTTTNFIMGASDYAVLNKIIATDQTRSMRFDGTINSFVGSVNGPVGGSVYFYAPGGFIFGATSAVNVGSLVLSASPIIHDANGNFINTSNRNEVSFGQATQPGATIQTDTGSLFTLNNEGSYVAMVAPRIIRNGDISVNGQAAMVAADGATIRFAPDGLFDIQVSSGSSTTTGNGMTGGGDITGPASSGPGDNHRIYMVTVPKNDALTMAISAGATLGFEVANAADVVGNAIVLSAGHDIVNGQVQDARSPGGGTGATSISLFNADFTSTVLAQATGNINVTASNSNVGFAWDLDATADGQIFVISEGDALLDVANDLTLSVDDDDAGEGVSAQAGNIYVEARNFGSMHIGGDAYLSANATGGQTSTAGVQSGDGTGGTVYFWANQGGNLNLDGNLTAYAVGFGGDVNVAGANAGSGFGGYVRILTVGDPNLVDLNGSGGSMFIGGNVVADVSGYGADGAGVECNLCDGLSGNGTAGQVWLSAQAGVESTLHVVGDATIHGAGYGGDSRSQAGGFGTGGDLEFFYGNGAQTIVDGNVFIEAGGVGGDSDSGTGGTGTGGSVFVWRSNADLTSGSLTVGGYLQAYSDGYGGDSFSGNGGVGQGGFSGIYTNVGSMTFNDFVNQSAGGYGGSTTTGNGGAGLGGVTSQAANGGTAIFAGAGGTITIVGSVYASVDGYGGSTDTGNGGAGTGGEAEFTAAGGTLTANSGVTLNATGNGGSGGGVGGVSGLGQGGLAVVRSYNNGSLSIADYGWLDASGHGGFDFDSEAASGDGRGGTALINAVAGGDLAIGGFAFVKANGEGGLPGEGFSGGTAGDGYGGEARIFAGDIGSVLSIAGNTTLEASGYGSGGYVGVGGDGYGGSAEIYARDGGQLSVTNDLRASANGIGGADWGGFGGGDGYGGGYLAGTRGAQVAVRNAAGGSLSVTGLTQVEADGLGGPATEESGITAGDGTGGIAQVLAQSGSLTLNTLQVNAFGDGGDTFGGTGGNGTGGNANISAIGGTISVTGTFASVNAAGYGGSGTFGGSGTGGGDIGNISGGAGLFASGAGLLAIAGQITVEATGNGGNGSNAGGAATGGVAQMFASAGGDIDINGLARVSADAFAGGGADGQGGLAQAFAATGSTIDLWQLNLRADGWGGDDIGSGAGDGYGGTATIEASGAGAAITLAQSIATGPSQDRELISADGFGGSTFGVGIGGTGTGGTSNINATAGGALTLASGATTADPILVRARGYGGSPEVDGATGGTGYGGTLNVVVDGGTLTTGAIQQSAIGLGGNTIVTTLNTNGGDGIGGTRNVSVLNGGTLTTWMTGGVSGGSAGYGTGTGDGGDGSGGIANFTVDNSTLNITGNSGFFSQTAGGEARGTGQGGDAVGGVAAVNITNGSTVNIASGASLSFGATGFGGISNGGGTGGSGTAGTVTANISNSTINGGSLSISAISIGGDGNNGGGSGTGGTAILNFTNATFTGNQLLVTANGTGGSVDNGMTGNGNGGTAQLNVFGNASTITAAGGINVQANGLGGSVYDGVGQTGNGTGGNASMFAATGATFNLNGAVSIAANGTAGSFVTIEGSPSGNGGIGDGGVASVFTNGGTINYNGNVSLSAAGVGGNAAAGTGGNAIGGSTWFNTIGGTLLVNGNLSLDGSALGGSGLVGGNAIASLPIDINGPYAASIYADSGGSTTVTGSATLNGSATGGSGSDGNGGNATAGEADVITYIGDIALGSLDIDATATGGNGGNGGNGGTAQGGYSFVAIGNGAPPVDGSLTLGTVAIDVSGIGGNGGDGAGANFGGNGGNGGNGTAGQISFSGSANGGTLISDNAFLIAEGVGGAGGAGGNGDSGTGGNGGAGGIGAGGFIQTGTNSYSGSPTVGGGFEVADLTIVTDATGGNGGNGGTGGGGNGAGGNGGNALGGNSMFLIRGVDASAGTVILTANATGGDGGVGSTDGNGGNATSGIIRAESKERFDHPEQRGNLTADAILGFAIAEGGIGAIDGTSTVTGGSFFRVLNGDATIGSVNFFIAGDLYVDGVDGSDWVSVRDGVANIGSFSYSTTGELALDANNGSMDAGSISLSAATFVPHTVDPAPTVVGTYVADTFAISTGGDFITNANLDSVNPLTIFTPGQILAVNIAGDDNVSLLANLGPISAGNVTSGGDILAQTNGAITLGNLDATGDILTESIGALSLQNVNGGGNVEINSSTSIVALDVTAGGELRSRDSGASSFGVLTAGTDVNVGSVGVLSFASAQAGEIVRIGSDASIIGGAVVAGDSIVATTFGLIDLGNLSAGIVNPSSNPSALYEVALVGGSIDVGSINATGDVQLAGFNGITTGNVTTTDRMFAVSDGNIALGNLSIGDYLLIGGWDMFAYTGTIHVDNTFDARPTFDSIEANTLGTISVGTIAADRVEMFADGNIGFGNVNAGDFEFDSGGAVTGGNILASRHAGGEAQGAIMLGNISVTGPSLDDDFSVGFASNTSIQVGTVNGFDMVGFATPGALTTANVTAGSLFIAMVSGNIVTGSITTDPSGEVYLADSSMFALGGGSDNFDETIVLALDPVATAGSITINGPVSTGLFRAATTAGLNAGAMTVDTVEASANQLTLGNINSSQAVILTGQAGVTTGNITTTSNVDITSSAGNIATGDIDSDFSIALDAAGNVSTGDLLAGSYVLIEAGGNVTTGDINAGLGVPILLGAIGPQDVGPGNPVEIFSGGSIVSGDITTDGYVGLYAANNITAGAISAEHDIIALAGGNAFFGAITTPERFILAGYGNFDNLDGVEGFDPELIFEIYPPDSTGGDATFAGMSTVGEFQSFVGGNTTVNSITATDNQVFSNGYIGIDTGGLLTINGDVSGTFVQLGSADIAIGNLATVSGDFGVSFYSFNANGTFIGDNAGATGGYRLSQAELNRVDTSSLGIEAITDRGASDRMTIGDLALDLRSGDAEGAYFAIDSDVNGGLNGTIRVVGNVAFTVNAGQEIAFEADTFEIDAATGSLALLDGSGALSGLLYLETRNIFVASADILAKLEANPQYAGFREELNAPAAVQRPNGVIRAANMELGDDDTPLENLLVQNTGTAALPAGFVVSDLVFTEPDVESAAIPPGSVNMVINGQIVTPNGTLTGIAVRDALVAEFGTEIFVAGSTINGCVLVGSACSNNPPPPPPPPPPPGPDGGLPPSVVVTPTQVAILTTSPLGNSQFGNEGDIAGGTSSSEGSEGSDGEASSPISAPQPLFDTRPLVGDEDVNEPISGAGNPSLYGITSDEDDDDDDDEDDGNGNDGDKAQPAGEASARTGDGQ